MIKILKIFGKEGNNSNITIKKHPYTFARVSAMRAKLIEKQDYHKMLKMTIPEIIEFISEYGYRKSIDELSANYSGVDLIERALSKNYTETVLKLKRISKDEVNILINAYVNRWDFINIKTILRGIYGKYDQEYAASLLVPVGNLSYNFLLNLIKLDDIGEVLGRMGIAEFDKVKLAFESFKETNQLVDLENALDRVYYNGLDEVSNRIKKGGEIFKEFLQANIDVVNIKLLLKLKKANISKDKVRKYLIGGGSLLSGKMSEKIAALRFEELISFLKRSKYKDIFENFDIRTEDTLVNIELDLDKLLIKKSSVSWHKHPLSALAIIGYMLAKEAEVRNITTIARAKQLGLEEEFIENKLLILG